MINMNTKSFVLFHLRREVKYYEIVEILITACARTSQISPIYSQ